MILTLWHELAHAMVSNYANKSIRKDEQKLL